MKQTKYYHLDFKSMGEIADLEIELNKYLREHYAVLPPLEEREAKPILTALAQKLQVGLQAGNIGVPHRVVHDLSTPAGTDLEVLYRCSRAISALSPAAPKRPLSADLPERLEAEFVIRAAPALFSSIDAYLSRPPLQLRRKKLVSRADFHFATWSISASVVNAFFEGINAYSANFKRRNPRDSTFAYLNHYPDDVGHVVHGIIYGAIDPVLRYRTAVTSGGLLTAYLKTDVVTFR